MPTAVGALMLPSPARPAPLPPPPAGEPLVERPVKKHRVLAPGHSPVPRPVAKMNAVLTSGDAAEDVEGSCGDTAPEMRRLGDGWRRTALVALTTLFLLLVVGAETTLGAFMVTYVQEMAAVRRLPHAPGLSPQAEGDLLTTAFWVAFTAGRFLSGAVSAHVSARRVLAAQLALLCAACMLLLAAPGSRGALWVAATLCGLGLSGCFGGAVGQAQDLVGLSGRMSGLFGAGALAGVSSVQLTASRVPPGRPEGIMAVVAAASFAAAAAMLSAWAVVDSAGGGGRLQDVWEGSGAAGEGMVAEGAEADGNEEGASGDSAHLLRKTPV